MYNYRTAFQEFLVIFCISLRLQQKCDTLLKHPNYTINCNLIAVNSERLSSLTEPELLLSPGSTEPAPVGSRLAGDSLVF